MAIEQTILTIPTTYIIPEEKDEMRVKLYQYFSDIAKVLNAKESGYYFNYNEFSTGQRFFPNPNLPQTDPNFNAVRDSWRITIDFGALPNTGTKSVAHGISVTNTTSFTRIDAVATDQAALIGFSIPGNGCSITVDATNVNITTPADLTAYNICYVYIEYLKF